MRTLESQLPPGLLLIGANQSATELTFEQLTAQMTNLIESLPPTPTATTTRAGNTTGNTAR
jgi:hypothetical protein